VSAEATEPVVLEGWPWRTARMCHTGCRFALRAMRSGFIGFYNSNNLTFAASIAFYTLLSLFPFLLLVLSTVSKLAIGPSGAASELLVRFVTNVFPSRFDFVLSQLQEMATAPLNLTVAGTILTLWGSMGVFGAITSAVNHAWDVEYSYSFFKHKLVAFVMMMAAGALAVTALILIGVVQVVEAHGFASIVARFPELTYLSGVITRNAPTPLFIVVVGLIYYFVPNTRVRLRDVWFGAILTAVLWRLAFAGFAWYVRDVSRFSIHGSIAAVVVFLIWIYLSAVILLYGVEVTAAYARLRSPRVPEQDRAPVGL
jgi:membrane protein